MFSRGDAEADEDNFIEFRHSDAGSSYLPLDDLSRILKSISILVSGRTASLLNER